MVYPLIQESCTLNHNSANSMIIRILACKGYITDACLKLKIENLLQNSIYSSRTSQSVAQTY